MTEPIDPERPLEVGDYVSRGDDGVHVVRYVNPAGDLVDVECVREPSRPWCKVGDLETNLSRRYHRVEDPSRSSFAEVVVEVSDDETGSAGLEPIRPEWKAFAGAQARHVADYSRETHEAWDRLERDLATSSERSAKRGFFRRWSSPCRIRSLWTHKGWPFQLKPTVVEGMKAPSPNWELAFVLIEPLDLRSRLERWLAKVFRANRPRPHSTTFPRILSDATLVEAADFSRELLRRAAIDIERTLNDPNGPKL